MHAGQQARAGFFPPFLWPTSHYSELVRTHSLGVRVATTHYRYGFGTMTAVAAVVAAVWRISISPIEMVKTTLQVGGQAGLERLKAKVATDGLRALYTGSLASCAGSTLGYLPWFTTFNFMDGKLHKSVLCPQLDCKLHKSVACPPLDCKLL
jgi:hypothetical protein